MRAAADFCRKLTALPNEHAANNRYRLPTEAEWEYACRAGTNSACYFGENTIALRDHAWIRDNSSNQTHPVGQKAPNQFGLHDMYGNVFEWCIDWYGDYDTRKTMDPIGQRQGTNGGDKVMRGRSWDDVAENTRSASRAWKPPSFKNTATGFRVLLEVP